MSWLKNSPFTPSTSKNGESELKGESTRGLEPPLATTRREHDSTVHSRAERTRGRGGDERAGAGAGPEPGRSHRRRRRAVDARHPPRRGHPRAAGHGREDRGRRGTRARQSGKPTSTRGCMA